jgi:hypothetical protein
MTATTLTVRDLRRQWKPHKERLSTAQSDQVSEEASRFLAASALDVRSGQVLAWSARWSWSLI